MATIRIGTSGWHYDHWVGPFYPGGTPSDAFLSYYAGRFGTVEINASFYRLPEESTLVAWRDGAPDGFTFAAKASRYLTHMKKLNDPSEPLGTFLTRMRTLGPKLGPVLFQLPPNWGFDPDRLASFLDRLPSDLDAVFEFRDESWFDDRAYDLLRAHGATFCIYDLAGRISPKIVTSDTAYVRLHGPHGAYQGSYDAQTLSGWAGAFSTWASQGTDVYCYFDNDQAGYAPRDALTLAEMLGV